MKILAYTTLVFVILMGVIQQLLYLPHLPAEVASHFDGNGRPDGKMPKASFMMLMLGVNVGLPLFMGLIGLSLKFIPSSLINLPNKDYWLAPERRAQTLRDTEIMMTWLATLTTLFLIGMSHLTFRANLAANGLEMTKFIALLIAYLAVIFGVCIRSVLRYRVCN